MIHDLESRQPTQDDEAADVCIVGAGAAGIILAVELLAQGKRVLLLEGGGDDVEERSQEPYGSEVVGLPHRGIHTGRFRAKGGTTTRWGGQILEFDARDFAARPAVALSGWPFPKDELAPFYARALTLEGLGNVTRDDAALWREIGLQPPVLAGLEPYFSRWCPEPALSRVHRQTLENHAALSLWLHANVVELMTSGETVTGLRTRTLTGIEHVFRAQTFVFCLGAIESCRFFLQPHPNAHLWNRSGLLGKHFQDHIDVNAAEIRPTHAARFHAVFDNVFSRGFKYHPKLRLSPRLQEQHATLNVAATMYFVSDADVELDRLKSTAKKLLRGRIREVSASDIAHAGYNLPLLLRQVYRYTVKHRAYNPPSAAILLRVHCEQQPDSLSSISLSDQRDSLGLFRTRLNWFISDRELATIREYVLQAQVALAGLAEVVPDAKLLSGDSTFRAQCNDSNHHMGGMRMAQTPQQGVVDLNLRLHGTANCFVCSGAVFPTSSFSNPTHTVLALAIRLAEHLRNPGLADATERKETV